MTRSRNWFVIINPTSGNGSGKRKWPVIEQLLNSNGFEYRHSFTEYAGHASYLVKNAVENGIRNIMCVGGDGTLHNVLNGIMKQSAVSSEQVRVGAIPVGTGNDWVRSMGISSDIRSAVLTVMSGRYKTQDIGKISMADSSNDPVYFMNISGLGFDGYVVSKIERYKRLGPLAYFVGALAGILTFRNFMVTINMNSTTIQERVLMVMIGLGRFSGGGMQLTKDPDPFDGYFDVSVAYDFTAWDVIKNIGNLFNGKIVNFKKVNTYKTNKFSFYCA
jgi:YegS/Rv2252/BmrU family lipid kinase